MRIAGGVLALLSGSLGLIVAGFCLVYALSGGMDSEEGTFITVLFFGAATFAIISIILGIGILRGQNVIPGILLLALSILFAILSRNLGRLSLFMLMPGFSGFLAIMGSSGGKALAAQGTDSEIPNT